MIVSAKWQDVASTIADITLDTGTVISGVHVDSRHWQGFQDWIALGNTPDPADPIVRPPKSDAPLSGEEVASELVRKGLVSRAEFDAIKAGR